MHGINRLISFLILCVVFSPSSAFSASFVDPQTMDIGEVVISDSAPRFSIFNPNRNMIVLNETDIRALPAATVADVLEYAGFVDARRRGPGGVQADFHIRGAGFENTTVLLNGTPVNDPQTGHHNADLPVPLDAVTRIEILPGASAGAPGASATGGTINIITSGEHENELTYGVSAGRFGTKESRVFVRRNRTYFSMERAASDGFRDGTDYNTTSLFAQHESQMLGGDAFFSAGYTGKTFGAHSFYTPGWPSREQTRTRFMNMRFQSEDRTGRTGVSLYQRRHADMFMCSADQPSLCMNRHVTNKQGAIIEKHFNRGIAGKPAVLGLLVERDHILSSSIGTRDAHTTEVSIQQSFDVSKRLSAALSATRANRTGYTARTSWSADAGYDISPRFRARAAVSKAFRAPSYTELYYRDPAHVSQSGLLPENILSGEIGVDYTAKNAEFSLTAHTSRVRGLIDWTRTAATAPWSIRNNPSMRFQGVSSSLKTNINKKTALTLSHEYLRIKSDAAQIYKYATQRPRHIFLIGLNNSFKKDLSINIQTHYEKSANQKSISLLDLSLKKKIRGNELQFQINNIFDRQYQDVTGVPMPGVSFLLIASISSHQH